MLTTIKTSKENKEIVTQLTRKLNLGAENVIARLALSYSLAKERRLALSEIRNSRGKEYSAKVLFGDYSEFYIALVCVHYKLYKSDKDIPKYIKMHIDDGLELIHKDVEKKSGITGAEFLINEIEMGMKFFK
jgi:DNA sulfur modification protein DndE